MNKYIIHYYFDQSDGHTQFVKHYVEADSTSDALVKFINGMNLSLLAHDYRVHSIEWIMNEETW